jgi:hypothetical protein
MGKPEFQFQIVLNCQPEAIRLAIGLVLWARALPGPNGKS